DLELGTNMNVTVNSSTGTVTVESGGTLNITGGSLTAKGIDKQPGGTVKWTRGNFQLTSGLIIDPTEGLFDTASLAVSGTSGSDRIALGDLVKIGTTGASTLAVSATGFNSSTFTTSNILELAPGAAATANVSVGSRGHLSANSLYVGGDSSTAGGAAT